MDFITINGQRINVATIDKYYTSERQGGGVCFDFTGGGFECFGGITVEDIDNAIISIGGRVCIRGEEQEND